MPQEHYKRPRTVSLYGRTSRQTATERRCSLRPFLDPETTAGSASPPPGPPLCGAPAARGRLRRGSGGPRGWSAARPTNEWAGRSARPARRQRLASLAACGLTSPERCTGLPTTMPATPNRRQSRASERRSSRRLLPPLQRQHRLRRQAQLVRHGHADAAIADIEAEIAGMRGGFQLLAPGF